MNLAPLPTKQLDAIKHEAFECAFGLFIIAGFLITVGAVLYFLITVTFND
jgi:uncharacterized membrane protein YphA (DoxX/SURF4 family)